MPRRVFFTLLPGVEGTFYNEKFVDEVLDAVGRCVALDPLIRCWMFVDWMSLWVS